MCYMCSILKHTIISKYVRKQFSHFLWLLKLGEQRLNAGQIALSLLYWQVIWNTSHPSKEKIKRDNYLQNMPDALYVFIFCT